MMTWPGDAVSPQLLASHDFAVPPGQGTTPRGRRQRSLPRSRVLSRSPACPGHRRRLTVPLSATRGGDPSSAQAPGWGTWAVTSRESKAEGRGTRATSRTPCKQPEASLSPNNYLFFWWLLMQPRFALLPTGPGEHPLLLFVPKHGGDEAQGAEKGRVEPRAAHLCPDSPPAAGGHWEGE